MPIQNQDYVSLEAVILAKAGVPKLPEAAQLVSKQQKEIADMLADLMMASYFPTPTPSGRTQGQLVVVFGPRDWPRIMFAETFDASEAKKRGPKRRFAQYLKSTVTRSDLLQVLQGAGIAYYVSACHLARKLLTEGKDQNLLDDFLADTRVIVALADAAANSR